MNETMNDDSGFAGTGPHADGLRDSGSGAQYFGGTRQQPGGDPMALRIYERPGGETDFPVLKAFQEYLAAEQAKSHKRMLALAIFFIILLVIVVLTFMIITSNTISRNQHLEDRLLDMRSAPATPSAEPAKVLSEAEIRKQVEEEAERKAIMAKLAGLEAELNRARAAAAEKQSTQAAAPVAVPPPQAPSQPAIDSSAAQRQLAAIKQQQDEIKAEREKLKAEKEALHKEEVERQRRRLYPEFYAREDARKAAEEAAKNPPPAPPAPAAAPAAANPAATVPAAKPTAAAPAAPAPQPKAEPPKKSALQILLEQDDVPTTARQHTLTDEEQQKMENDKDLQKLLGTLDADAKDGRKPAVAPKPGATAPKAADTKPNTPVQKPAPAAKPVDATKTSAKTENLTVGANGKAIPWMVDIPGETPVEPKTEKSEKPQKAEPIEKKADAKASAK